jgi:hypothetical protein
LEYSMQNPFYFSWETGIFMHCVLYPQITVIFSGNQVIFFLEIYLTDEMLHVVHVCLFQCK